MKTSILMTLLSCVLSLGLVWAVSEIAHADGVAEARAAAPPASAPSVDAHPYRPLFALGVAEPAVLAGPATSPPAIAGPATSPAVAPDPGEDAGGFIQASFDAIRSKNGWLIASVITVLVTFLLRLGVRRKTGFLGWFATDRGGVLLAAIVASLGGFAHATAAGTAPGWPLVVVIIEAWLGAIGMYVAIKRAVAPRDLEVPF